MKSISKVLSGKSNDAGKSTFRLATGVQSDPLTASKRETPIDDRIKPEKLERAWRRVPIVYNSINKLTQIIMSKEWRIEGENADFYRDFLDDVGDVGSSDHWDDLFQTIFRYQAVYGEAFIELVENEEGTRIVDLTMIDPKSIDYAKTGKSTIALDRFGNNLGYVQELPYGSKIDEQVYEPPEGMNLKNHEIYFPADRIAHFKLYTFGEGFYPVGLLEPAFEAAERSYQLQKDFGDKAHNTLFPMRIASVGDETHEPSPEEVNTILENLRNAQAGSEAALPYYVDVDVLESENPDTLIEFFNHFDEEIVKAMGLPKAFATGEAGRVNRASLQAQNRIFQISLNDIIDRTCRTIESQIFAEIAEKEGHDEYPSVEFKFDIDPHHQIERATRIRGDMDDPDTMDRFHPDWKGGPSEEDDDGENDFGGLEM